MFNTKEKLSVWQQTQAVVEFEMSIKLYQLLKTLKATKWWNNKHSNLQHQSIDLHNANALKMHQTLKWFLKINV